MPLIIFDIDGTISDSVDIDDRCFLQTFKDLYNIDLRETDWSGYSNVTDWGLSREIFRNKLGRDIQPREVLSIKLYFYQLLKAHQQDISPIPGVLDFIASLIRDPDFEVALATGGWKETALLKLSTLGLDTKGMVLKSSNDHFDRKKIVEKAIESALNKAPEIRPSPIIYFGDGLWDYQTCRSLGISFIGIDSKNDQKLASKGVKNVIKDYRFINKNFLLSIY